MAAGEHMLRNLTYAKSPEVFTVYTLIHLLKYSKTRITILVLIISILKTDSIACEKFPSGSVLGLTD